MTAAHIPENRTEQPVQKKKESEAEEAGQTAAEAYLGKREEVPLDGAAAEWQLIYQSVSTGDTADRTGRSGE